MTYLCLGSSASRRPSPIMLNEGTVGTGDMGDTFQRTCGAVSMPWKAQDIMSLKHEFLRRAQPVAAPAPPSIQMSFRAQ